MWFQECFSKKNHLNHWTRWLVQPAQAVPLRSALSGPSCLAGDHEPPCPGLGCRLFTRLAATRGERRGKAKLSLDTGFSHWSSRALLLEICFKPWLEEHAIIIFFNAISLFFLELFLLVRRMEISA